jgi:hypothetical protein
VRFDARPEEVLLRKKLAEVAEAAAPIVEELAERAGLGPATINAMLEDAPEYIAHVALQRSLHQVLGHEIGRTSDGAPWGAMLGGNTGDGDEVRAAGQVVDRAAIAAQVGANTRLRLQQVVHIEAGSVDMLFRNLTTEEPQTTVTSDERFVRGIGSLEPREVLRLGFPAAVARFEQLETRATQAVTMTRTTVDLVTTGIDHADKFFEDAFQRLRSNAESAERTDANQSTDGIAP